MEEKKYYGINWIGLFIKVIVFVIIVLLSIWLISKVTSKNKGLPFEENKKLFLDATVEYFKDNLPEKETINTITLKKLIAKEYIETLKDEKGNECNITKSTSQIELEDEHYNIKSEIVCGNKSEITYIKLGNENCEDCYIKVEGLEIKTKQEEQQKTENNEQSNNNPDNTSNTTNNTNTNNNSNIESPKPAETILYEYIKETTEYSDWYVGKVTGNNIENSTQKVSYSKYCKEDESYVYRTISYTTKKQTYTYTLELINLKDKNLSSVDIKKKNYFTNYQDYKDYLNNVGESVKIIDNDEFEMLTYPSANTIKNSSLDSDNFTYTISEIYEKNNKYYVDIKVRVKNLTGADSYYSTQLEDDIYFVPIEFTVDYKYKDKCIIDKTENKNNYENYKIVDTWRQNTDVYRYKLTVLEYKYSNATSLEGYTKTGKTKVAS